MTDQNSTTLTTKNLIIVHGLNAHIRGFNDLRDLFKHQGYNVHPIILPSHYDSNSSWDDFVYEQLKNELIKATHNYENYFFLGHSLGALLYLDLLSDIKQSQHAVLLAPSLFTKFNLQWSQFLPKNLKIPSFNDPDYRVHSSVPVSAYQQLNYLQQNIKKNNNIPTNKLTLFLDENDELVDFQKSVRYFKSWGPIQVIPPRKQILRYHLMYSKITLDSQWDWFCKRLMECYE
jgi:alpha-beta hydrolase superfamily lysophospholipase